MLALHVHNLLPALLRRNFTGMEDAAMSAGDPAGQALSSPSIASKYRDLSASKTTISFAR